MPFSVIQFSLLPIFSCSYSFLSPSLSHSLPLSHSVPLSLLSTPEQRHQLISGLYGNVHRLARHKEASEVVETAYNDYANASERAALVQEFYGRKFALFKSKEGEEKGLEEILAGDAIERERVLCHMKEALSKLLDK